MDTYNLIIESFDNYDFSRLTLADINIALNNKWISESEAEMIAGIILDC